MAVFLWWERRVEQPIVPIELFRMRTFSLANLAGFATGVGMFGTIMFVPLFVQGVLGGSATSSGLVLTPLMLAMMATSVGSGQVISRTGRYRWALLLGPVMMGTGFALLTQLDVRLHARAGHGRDGRRRPRPRAADAEPRARGPERRPEPPHGRRDQRGAVLAARSAGRSACR